jgi:hypothetical protein
LWSYIIILSREMTMSFNRNDQLADNMFTKSFWRRKITYICHKVDAYVIYGLE